APGSAGVLLGFEHLEHTVRDEEAADHVRRGTDDRDKPEERAQGAVLGPGNHQRPDQRDTGDRIGCRHERCVEEGRHARDDVIAEEAGEHEDVEPKFKVLRVRRHAWASITTLAAWRYPVP